MRTYALSLLALLVVAVLVLPLCGCPKKVAEAPPPIPEGHPPTATGPATTPDAGATPAAGEAKWMENPTLADIPAGKVKGMVNGVAFEAGIVRIQKGDGKCKLEIADKAPEKPTGMLTDDTEVKMEFTLEPGKPGEFIKKMADKDPENTDGWYSYEQKDGSPMTMNADWAVAFKIDEWTLAKDPSDEAVLGKVKGKIFLTFKDDAKTFVAGEFEGVYFE
jgi:hypothetical protein